MAPLSAQMVGLRFTAADCGRWHRGPSDLALGQSRAGVEADKPGGVDYERNARRQLEDQADGGGWWPTTLPERPRNAVPWHATCRFCPFVLAGAGQSFRSQRQFAKRRA